MLLGLAGVELIEQQPAGFDTHVVTGDAVALDKLDGRARVALV
jgi:hypothetical protein